LIVGANLPDIDVLAYLGGPAADLQWRRGWTHGLLAMVVLPFVLAGSLQLLHRFTQRRRTAAITPGSVPAQLLLLSFIAILSHPILDTLNTYGVRWLMPFSGTWFYADTLFIVDPVVWAVLALGVYYSWRSERAQRPVPGKPATIAMTAVAVYLLAMAISGVVAGAMIRRELETRSGKRVERMMVSPVFLSPLTRRFVIENRGEYRTGSFDWLRTPRVDRNLRTFRKDQVTHPAVRIGSTTAVGRRFLSWARFPIWRVDEPTPGHYVVHLIDLRYAEDSGAPFGAVSIPVTLR
jgi:inner membrane protein